MGGVMASWQIWALLSALFAALTAIFAKIGVENSIRTSRRWFAPSSSSCRGLRPYGHRELAEPRHDSNCSIAFLVLSGLATGASWVCYFRALKIGDASKVAPIDKLSVVLVALFAVTFLGEELSLPNWLGVGLIAAAPRWWQQVAESGRIRRRARRAGSLAPPRSWGILCDR